MTQSQDDFRATRVGVVPSLSTDDGVLLRQLLSGRPLSELARLHRSDERRIARRIRGLAERIAADGPRRAGGSTARRR